MIKRKDPRDKPDKPPGKPDKPDKPQDEISGAMKAVGRADTVVFSGSIEASEAPSAGPELSWTPSHGAPEFTMVTEGTVGGGDTLEFEIQPNGGSWINATTFVHMITSEEDAISTITLGLGFLTGGSYEARCRVSN